MCMDEAQKDGIVPVNEIFPIKEGLNFESPSHKRAFEAVVNAVNIAVKMDMHPKTKRARITPLFTYFEGLRDLIGNDSFFHPQTEIVTGELFHSMSDPWSRSMDLPAVEGVIDKTDPKNPKKCIRLGRNNGSHTYSEQVLDLDPDNPDSKYYKPSIEEDGIVRLARKIHTGETLYLPLTAEQAEQIADIFEGMDKKLKRRADWIEARIKNRSK